MYLYIQVFKKDSFSVSSKHLLKILHKLSYSILSITLSFKGFLYNLSKDSIVYWSFSYYFLYFLYLFTIMLFITLLPIDKAHADAVDIGVTIKPFPVRESVIDLDVVALIMKVSNDFNNVAIVL